MKYQLVIQWPASSIQDYDNLISVEDILIENLNDGSKVDGHDAGSGEMNIFIHTDNPMDTFAAVKSVLGAKDIWIDSRVAYRKIEEDDFTILWPKDLLTFEVA